MYRDLPVWRSMLFTPAISERFIASAARCGADAVQLDLEDSVPLEQKGQARDRIARAARTVAASGSDVIVRINSPWRLAVRDLEAAVLPTVRAINLPKTADAGHIRAVAEVIDELEAERGIASGATGIVAMIETPSALLDMRAIASASPRVRAVALGAEDLAANMDMRPGEDALYGPSTALVAAARAAGCLPIGLVASVADYGAGSAFADAARRARGLGFAGAMCVHPQQVSTLNDAFRPDPDELADARAIVEAAASNRGAFSLDGRMVDRPVVERARAVLNAEERIIERQSKRRNEAIVPDANP